MTKMGKYCKAYPINRLREYQRWIEMKENFQKEKSITERKDGEVDDQVAEKSHLYLQENYVVTDGIFIDEHIIFDQVTPEWIDFCKNTLKFEVPVYETVTVRKE
jgi:hypothetical protein